MAKNILAVDTASSIDGPPAWLQSGLSMIGVALCVVPVVILCVSVFFEPFETVFGWTRGQVALTATAITLAMAVATPIAGILIDRLGTKPVLITSLAAFAFSMFLWPILITAFGLTGLYISATLTGILASGSTSIAYVKILSGWFERHLGFALGLAMSGIAIGGMVMPALSAYFIEAYDWKAGLYVLGATPLIVALPLLGLFLKEPKSAQQPALQVPEKVQDGSLVSEALANRNFWFLIVVFFLAATAIHGIQINLVAMGADNGLSRVQAVGAISFMFFASFLARIVVGFLVDRIFAPYVGAACFVGAAIGAFMLISANSVTTMYTAALLIGIGAGAESDLLGLLVRRYFGLRAFGKIYGWVFAAFMIGSAIGPFVLAFGFDQSGSYNIVLVISTGALIVAGALLLMLSAFPSWAVSEKYTSKID